MNFQSRLVSIGRDFDKIVHIVSTTRGTWTDIDLIYKGKEVLDGILNEHQDIIIRDIIRTEDELRIKVSVRSTAVGSQIKNITVFFDPTTPFYKKTESGKIEPSTEKLKQQVNFQVKGISSFDKDVLDIGTIKEGDIISFNFNRTSDSLITGAQGTCGCTSIESNSDSVSGTIDTKGFKGQFQKTINVYFGDFGRNYVSNNGILQLNSNTSVYPLVIKGVAE